MNLSRGRPKAQSVKSMVPAARFAATLWMPAWITPSTFHFRRVLNGPLHPSAEAAHEPVVLTTEDTGDAVRLRSRLIEVTLEKQGVKVGVRRLDGTPLRSEE